MSTKVDFNIPVALGVMVTLTVSSMSEMTPQPSGPTKLVVHFRSGKMLSSLVQVTVFPSASSAPPVSKLWLLIPLTLEGPSKRL